MHNKLKLNKNGPCQIHKKISDNAYVLELSEELKIFSMFNVADLYKYEEGLTSREESTIDCQGKMPSRQE